MAAAASLYLSRFFFLSLIDNTFHTPIYIQMLSIFFYSTLVFLSFSSLHILIPSLLVGIFTKGKCHSFGGRIHDIKFLIILNKVARLNLITFARIVQGSTKEEQTTTVLLNLTRLSVWLDGTLCHPSLVEELRQTQHASSII